VTVGDAAALVQRMLTLMMLMVMMLMCVRAIGFR
jgi:hypothetical protein